MFDTPVQAAAALQNYFDQPRVESILQALIPAMILRPASGHRRGGTRLGGTPDAPAGFEWPRPVAPDNPEGIAARGHADAAQEMLAHLERRLPFAFIGQIDLNEAATLGMVASPLPAEGRLLFFYDLSMGPWETGTRVAKVIWDCSPTDQLHSLVMPGDLHAAATREADEWSRTAAESADNHDVVPGTRYGAPARAMMLQLTWRLPHLHALEISALPAVHAIADGEPGDADAEAFYEAYEEAIEESGDLYPDESWQRQQLLGSPLPEQSDPRYDAAVVSEWGVQSLPSQEWTQHRDGISLSAREWILLLQIDVGDWMQARFVEGMVYFLIRRSHLEQRRFDEVVAVYQQT